MTVDTRAGEIRPSYGEVRASVATAKSHLEVAARQVLWQIENRAWEVLGYADWDEMRETEYGGAAFMVPRAERPELVARMRKAGLTNQEAADTAGISEPTARRDWAAQSSNDDSGEAEPITNSRGQQRPSSYAPRPKTPAPSPLGEVGGGAGPISTEASPAGDVDHTAAPAEAEDPGATSDDATAATGGSQGHDSLRLSEALDRYPELQHYADRGDAGSVIRLAAALDGYGISERHHRRELLARTIAADVRREAEPEADEGPDPVDVVEEMFNLANAFNQRVTTLGGPEAVATAMGHATQLEADLWRDEFAALITTATDLHAATKPTLRRIK